MSRGAKRPSGPADKWFLTPFSLTPFSRANLILFGSVETNDLIRELAPQLPIVPTRDGVRIGHEQHRGAGLFMIYPDPRTLDRYVVIMHRHFPWRVKDLEALPWLLPDYVIFDPAAPLRRTAHNAWEALDAQLRNGTIREQDVPEDERPLRYLPDGFIRAGFFDEDWKLRP